tara:strand:+ start:485 stop:1012 length:528 start_codon:yes stop_codon:yes gene_type:complete
MKYFVKFFVVTLILLGCTYAQAEQKIAYIDMKVVLNTSKPGKEAQDFLKDTMQKNQDKFKKAEQDLKDKENDLLEKKTVISEEEYKKRTDELRKEVINYQTERREAFAKVAKQRTEARQELLKALEPILQNYIKEDNISIVLDKKVIIAGINNDYDITNVVIKKLNKALPSLNLK